MLSPWIPFAAAICVAGLLAGCGGGTGSSGSATGNGDALALEFANCMRAHGVPGFPDPGRGSGLDSQDNPDSPAFKNANTTCEKLEPNNPQPSLAPSESRKLAALKFAQCMRKHGVPNFPDPTLTAPSGTDEVIDLGGIFFPVGSGLDLRSPAVKHASTACGMPFP